MARDAAFEELTKKIAEEMDKNLARANAMDPAILDEIEINKNALARPITEKELEALEKGEAPAEQSEPTTGPGSPANRLPKPVKKSKRKGK